MKAIDFVNFLKTPPDRDVIRRWTVPPGSSMYRVELPPPRDPGHFTFLALGDSGDSAGMGAQETPQDAVARYLAADAALPERGGAGEFVIHTGDVVYMAGEHRLYDRNFRRPYAPFLTADSTVDQLRFRLPFLPVPGNHDYYDFSGWATTLARTPVIGAGVKALARELFAFEIPSGGSDMGGAYMRAFVDPEMERTGRSYEPGAYTRLPNRYYRFRIGDVDFFALDSNTLEAPPPSADLNRERKSAREHVAALEGKARTLSHEISRDEQAVETWLAARRRDAARTGSALETARALSAELGAAIHELEGAITAAASEAAACAEVSGAAAQLRARCDAAARTLGGTRDQAGAELALEHLDDVVGESCDLLEEVEGCLGPLAEGAARSRLLHARARVALARRTWRETVTGRPPAELCDRLKKLSAEALDIQRDLARERRRMGREPGDYDASQLAWLRQALEESIRDRPEGWRILYLHQPLYTTIGNHSENSDVAGVRDNLIPLLRDRVHLILAGHSHAFEWFRSSALPTTALVVTGGGGQPWLWRSILDPKRFRQYRHLYRSLCGAGATECVVGGRGPAAPDGQNGSLYNYVQIEVTPQVLRVRPIGVRRLAQGYRREQPMPVFHVPEMACGEPVDQPPWNPRILESIEVRRGDAPRLCWG